MAKRSTKKVSKKEYTLSEFKAWLDGVEELQPSDWAPTADQWKTIRDKIHNIVEEVVEVEVPARPAPVVERPVYPMTPQHPSAPPRAMPTAPAAPPPTQPSALENVATPEMTPAAAAALKGNLPTEMVPDASGKLKTPNIDTTDGNFNSSFE